MGTRQDTPDKPLSVFQRRWRKFKTIKRGWYSFVEDHSFQVVVHGINTNYSLIG